MIKKIGSYKRYRIGLDGLDDLRELKLIHMYVFTTEENVLSPIDKHNPEAKWASIKEAKNLLTHKKDKEFFSSSITHFQQYLNLK